MPNLIYAAPGTSIVFAASGGDAVITLASLADAAGRISAQFDRGSGSKPAIYRWQARTRANVSPVVGVVARIYLALGDDGSFVMGDWSTADQAVSVETLLLNAQFLGSVAADIANTTQDFVASGLVEIRSRYIQVAWWNAMGQALSSTAGNHEFRLTPYSDEIQ